MRPGNDKINLVKTATYDELALERAVKEHFSVQFDVRALVLPKAPVSRTATATVFTTKKKQLFAYIEATSPMLLSDVKKLIVRMGLKAELYVPPRGATHYFEDIGREKFRQVFPARTNISDQEIMFYKTLAPYNPALVLISEVKRGEIYQFDPDARGEWRVGARFAYRKIRAS